MLDKQYHLYSVDTGHFYSGHEKYLHDMYCRYRSERNDIQSKIAKTENSQTNPEYLHWTELLKHKTEKARQTKEKLLNLLSNKVRQNKLTHGKDHIRVLKEDSLHDTNIISIFDSALSRTIGISQDELTESLLVVQVYYFDIFQDISFYGFTYKGEKYRYFTSSAGQIRRKKTVFIKESVWRRIEKTIMCGLTIDKINAKGGNNVNKHLAYMALANSATDEWNEFDIDKSIVIEDFETNVYGTFDFVDESDYSITRKTDYVPIPHTDGAGMVLPSVSSVNFMVRAPWIKGLLGVFDFRKFVQVHDYAPIITDIYGKEHDIIKEDIQIIFTRSQFKMAKYYDSWDEYKAFFRMHHCSAGKCNVEEERIKNAKINYQMLQTLTSISDEEINLLTDKSAERIRNICSSKESMLDILGITPYNTNMSPFQQAVKIYPALLSDTYAKDVIREAKNSLLRKYRSGKLEVDGKFTFLLPDFYAACEYWFGHIENPPGLLSDKEVFCWLFKHTDRLDCLRSPHLYKEHAIRYNAANETYGERCTFIREWFPTNAVYTSTHDLISKLLQFDVDGDRSLVIADEDFIKIAERNMEGIVPLYYNMRKAEPTELNHQTIYDGLIKAFTNGNIGLYSNEISKIWNHDVFMKGSGREKQEAMDTVKLLCMENNFCIDAAKTLYMPKRPAWFHPVVSKYTNCKLPAFFEFAKDKDKSQLSVRNESLVNKIYDRIPDKPINTRGLKLGRIEYRKMMSNGNIVCKKKISDLYDKLNRQYRYMVHMKDEYIDNLRYIACKIRGEFAKSGIPEETIADMLVEYLYGREKRYKQLLWFCYGQYIVRHLEQNIAVPKTKYIPCVDCNEWFEIPLKNKRTCRCRACQIIHNREYERQKKRRQRLSPFNHG